MCDVSARRLAEAAHLCHAAGLPQGVRVTSHLADISREAEVLRFCDEAAAQHATDCIHLLFNNAGVSGGGSLIVNDRDEWELTFNIYWGGVYFTTRAFLPVLRAADQAHLVNTSSINGFWASVGPDVPHSVGPGRAGKGRQDRNAMLSPQLSRANFDSPNQLCCP